MKKSFLIFSLINLASVTTALIIDHAVIQKYNVTDKIVDKLSEIKEAVCAKKPESDDDIVEETSELTEEEIERLS